MEVICIEEEAFYELFEKVVARLQPTEEREEDKWISPDDAMGLLGITSTTTLQKYRDEGLIEFAQLSKRKILYSRESIGEYLENKRRKIF
jgi:hypothetical protein